MSANIPKGSRNLKFNYCIIINAYNLYLHVIASKLAGLEARWPARETLYEAEGEKRNGRGGVWGGGKGSKIIIKFLEIYSKLKKKQRVAIKKSY